MTTKKQWRAFSDKMGYEGGIGEMLEYGGAAIFPEEVRPAAEAVALAMTNLRTELKKCGLNENGEFEGDDDDETEEDEDNEDE
jgi:hypothetical protein